MNRVSRADVTDVARAIAQSAEAADPLRKARYIFWLGAGVSRSAGIPVAEGVVDRLFDRRWRLGQAPTERALEALSKLSETAADERRRIVRDWARTNEVCGAN